MGGKTLHFNPTVTGGPPWDAILEAPISSLRSPFSGSGMNDDGSFMFEELLMARPYNRRLRNVEMEENDEVLQEYDDLQMDDYFYMYELKVRRCVRGRSHDWSDCPYAHPGEKARRRDPKRFHYSGNPCVEFRKGSCRKGDDCEFAHGVFECWLHPTRYRTQPCKDGRHCHRRICFFAHTSDQIRLLSPATAFSYDGSPIRLGISSSSSSPTSTLYFPHSSTPTDSPPMSPVSPLGPNSICDLTSSMRNLQTRKATRLSMSPMNGSAAFSYSVRPIPFVKSSEMLDEDSPAMERVESGKGIRAQIYAKLSRENALAQ